MHTRENPLAATLIPADAKAGALILVIEPQGTIVDSFRFASAALKHICIDDESSGALLDITVTPAEPQPHAPEPPDGPVTEPGTERTP